MKFKSFKDIDVKPKKDNRIAHLRVFPFGFYLAVNKLVTDKTQK